jgi:hypothetical protein
LDLRDRASGEVLAMSAAAAPRDPAYEAGYQEGLQAGLDDAMPAGHPIGWRIGFRTARYERLKDWALKRAQEGN